MSKELSLTAEGLADVFSSDFWDYVGSEYFCIGCEALGAHDPQRGCDACDDVYSPECCRHEQAEHVEELIREFAVTLCKAVDA